MTVIVKKLLTVEPGEPVNSQAVKLIPTDEFQRFSLAGLIDVKSVAPPNKDFHAPLEQVCSCFFKCLSTILQAVEVKYG